MEKRCLKHTQAFAQISMPNDPPNGTDNTVRKTTNQDYLRLIHLPMSTPLHKLIKENKNVYFPNESFTYICCCSRLKFQWIHYELSKRKKEEQKIKKRLNQSVESCLSGMLDTLDLLDNCRSRPTGGVVLLDIISSSALASRGFAPPNIWRWRSDISASWFSGAATDRGCKFSFGRFAASATKDIKIPVISRLHTVGIPFIIL